MTTAAGDPRARAVARSAARADVARAVLWVMMAGWAALLSWLSIARHQAFSTGRFDLGNMVQAVWSTAHGRPLETTDVAGRQFTRLGAHVDPVLAVFAPLYRLWPAPESLLVAQALIVALGALPAFWLGRRWLGDDRLALAVSAIYLLYPPLMWATATEFHPVTLAAPLLLFCIWAAEERRLVLLTVLAVAAALTKEQVGLALAVLGVWMFVRGSRSYGGALAALSAAWVAFAVFVVIPHYNDGEGSAFVARYDALGDGAGGIAAGVLSQPWTALEVAATPSRAGYLAALLLPLALLPLAAPLLAAAAAPAILLNVLSSWWPQQSIEFQYVAVIVPFLVAASILGLARLRRATRPELLRVALARPGPLAAVMVVWVGVSGVVLGPLPWYSELPLGAQSRADQYVQTQHSRAQAAGVALIPGGAVVSAGNQLGAHLSARRRIYAFPVVQDAEWVIVDRRRPFIADRLSPALHRAHVRDLLADRAFRRVYDRDGVLVLHRAARAAPR